MDEEKISIVLRESFAMNMESYISLYSINIDLVSGELMDNGNTVSYTHLDVYKRQDEELVRLRSHIETTREALKTGGSIGRKLDFIAQEMNREANTILSKANDLELSLIHI